MALTQNQISLAHRFPEGARCVATCCGDMWMMADARPLIGANCKIVKVTKGGLVQVALVGDENTNYSFPPRNVELLGNSVGG